MKRWFDDSYPDEAAFVILHPNFPDQHLLLPLFLNRATHLPLCVTIQKPGTDLNGLWSLLKLALQEQAELTLGSPGSNPQSAGRALGKALKPLKKFTLMIDGFDLAEQESACAMLAALAEDLPKGSQVVVGGRRLPIRLLELHPKREEVVLYPVSPDRMLLDYVAQPTEQMLLEVYGHGPGRVLVNGRLIDQWDGVLPRALFFYFIDRGMATRDEIFSTFWPTLPVREATNVFHVTKRKISEILGFDLTVYWSGFYRISPHIELHYDVVKFVEYVQNADVAEDPVAIDLLERAIYLYHGTFLSTISSEWVESRREELQSNYVDALSNLARLRERAGQDDEALGLYLRAAAMQPHREDLARSAMALYSKHNQPARAIEIYERLATELKHRLNLTPDRRTVELADQIRALA